MAEQSLAGGTRVLNRRAAIVSVTTAALCASVGIYGFRALREHNGSDEQEGQQPPLSRDEMTLIAAMAEGIIPQTETPGAIAAGVPEFISKIFSDWFTMEEQDDFRAGLRRYQKLADVHHHRPFEACSAAQQHSLLVLLDEESMGAPHPPDKIPAFAKFKALTVIGYYSSEIGQNAELKSQINAGNETPNGPTFLSVAPYRNIA